MKKIVKDTNLQTPEFHKIIRVEWQYVGFHSYFHIFVKFVIINLVNKLESIKSFDKTRYSEFLKMLQMIFLHHSISSVFSSKMYN